MSGVPDGHDVPVPASLDHVTIAASDFARSLAFYEAALGALGLSRVAEFGDEEEAEPQLEVAAWGLAEFPVLWLVSAGYASTGVHICLRAGSREEVQAFHAAALAHGGTSHDAPRRWTVFRRGLFNAIVQDPDGNLVEAVAAE